MSVIWTANKQIQNDYTLTLRWKGKIENKKGFGLELNKHE